MNTIGEIMCRSTCVEAALSGEGGVMITFCRTSTQPYIMACGTADVNEICNQEKTVPLEWITSDGTDVSAELIEYVLPLIQGQVTVPYKEGLPEFAYRKD